MNNNKLTVLLIAFLLAACGNQKTQPVPTGIPSPSLTPAAASTPTSTPFPAYHPQPTDQTPTLSPELPDRPVFLAWPLPAYIGTARISQYPNSAWSWNYLDLNDGVECPPMFGYLLNLDSLPYWRNPGLPEAQDKALADPHQFEMVECYAPHAGTDIKAPPDTPVYASAAGRVQEWGLNGLNSMLVLKHCLGGTWDQEGQCLNGHQYYTTYLHINPNQGLLEEDLMVDSGTLLGTIYDQTINSHLHLEVGIDKRSYQSYINPWGQDAPPWMGCMWLDQSLCITPDPDTQKAAFLLSSGKISFQQGDRSPIKISTPEDIQSIRILGNRMAALDSSGNLYIKDGFSGDLSSWGIAAENVLEFSLAKNNIAILNQDHSLYEWHPGIEPTWQELAEDVKAFSISEHRTGYLSANGDLFIRDDTHGEAWITIAKNVQAFQVIDNRIGYIDLNGDLYVNEGHFSAEFELITSGIRAFQLSNVRLGIIDDSSSLLVQEGNLRGELLPQAEHIMSFQLADSRILAEDENGVFYSKNGNLFLDWTMPSRTDILSAVMNAATAVPIP